MGHLCGHYHGLAQRHVLYIRRPHVRLERKDVRYSCRPLRGSVLYRIAAPTQIRGGLLRCLLSYALDYSPVLGRFAQSTFFATTAGTGVSDARVSYCDDGLFQEEMALDGMVTGLKASSGGPTCQWRK